MGLRCKKVRQSQVSLTRHVSDSAESGSPKGSKRKTRKVCPGCPWSSQGQSADPQPVSWVMRLGRNPVELLTGTGTGEVQLWHWSGTSGPGWEIDNFNLLVSFSPYTQCTRKCTLPDPTAYIIHLFINGLTYRLTVHGCSTFVGSVYLPHTCIQPGTTGGFHSRAWWFSITSKSTWSMYNVCRYCS